MSVPNIRGRPRLLNEADRKRPDGMTIQIAERLNKEAKQRGLSKAAFMRMVFDWYFTMLDTQRSELPTLSEQDIQNS